MLLIVGASLLFRVEYQQQYNAIAENERLLAFSQYLVSRYEAGMDTRDFRPPSADRRDFPTFSIRDLNTNIRVFSTRAGDRAENFGQYTDFVSSENGQYRLYYYIDPYRGSDEATYPIVLTILALIVTAGFSLLLTSLITRPLLKLKTYVQGLGGNLSLAIEPSLLNRNDEFGSLATAMDEMATRIHELIESKQRLFYDVSHELRAPLARMQVASEIVRMRAENSGEDTKIYDRVDREIDSLNNLITELIIFAKEDNAQFIPEEINLEEVLSEAISDQGFEKSEDRIQCEIACKKPPLLVAKKVLIERVLKNILENAFKYSPKDSKISVKLLKIKSHYAIVVEDEGPGIPSEKLGLVTQPFTRLHGESIEGVGLGLSIVKRAVDDLNGKLLIENRTVGGLRVRIEFPA